MSVVAPTLDQLEDIAIDLGFDLTPERLGQFSELMEGAVASYNVIDAMPDEKPRVSFPRTPGYQPGPEENEYNA